MSRAVLHEWPSSTSDALAIQKELAKRVDTSRPLGPYKTVAAADVSFNKYDPWLYAGIVVAEGAAPGAAILEEALVAERGEFPYVPGFLSFRETPAILSAFDKLTRIPDVILCDGQGIAHPRGLGLACHIGLWLGLPTVGCAKSRLFGTFREPGPHRGDWTPLMDKTRVIGAVLRTKTKVSPLFVSPGHLCDLDSAVALVLAATERYRLPDLARRAHDAVNELRRSSLRDRDADNERQGD